MASSFDLCCCCCATYRKNKCVATAQCSTHDARVMSQSRVLYKWPHGGTVGLSSAPEFAPNFKVV